MLTRSRRKELLDNGVCEKEDTCLYTLDQRPLKKTKAVELSVFETIAILMCVLFLLMVFVKTDWIMKLYHYGYNYRLFRTTRL